MNLTQRDHEAAVDKTRGGCVPALGEGSGRARLRRTAKTSVLALGVVMAAVTAMVSVPAVASASPVWEVVGHHGPGTFPAGGMGEYTFVVNNVGTTSATGPVQLEIRLPAGVTTRVQGGFVNQTWMSVIAAFFDPVWDCGAPPPGASSLTCDSVIDPVPPGGRGLERLTVYVDVDAGASGALAAVATVSGGGADAVSAEETATVGAAETQFGIVPRSFTADAYGGVGDPERRAGAHPFRATAGFDFNLKRTFPLVFGMGPAVPSLETIGTVRNLDVKLPRGFVGNPLAAARCRPKELLQPNGVGTQCPPSSQVGVAQVMHAATLGAAAPTLFGLLPVYNMEPPPGVLADFALQLDGRPAHIYAHLDPSDYSVVTTVPNVNESLPIHLQRLMLWGQPADPIHDGDRWNPRIGVFGAASTVNRDAFLTLPSECGVPGVTTLRASSWQGDSAGPYFSDPITLSGCDNLVFGPTIKVAPDSTAPDAPAGLQVDIDLPQDGNPNGLGTPPLRDARVTLPEGMTINPSAADGLMACSDAELSLGTDDPVGCPGRAKIGTVTAETPVLEGPVEGSVYIRTQSSDDPASGEMFRMALVLADEERGLLVKLPGSVSADPQSGRLVATFKDNPQLPVERISVRIKGGARAPLANPSTCGTKTVEARLSSWGGQVSNQTDSFTIDCPGADGFSPTFEAGTLKPAGGAFSPFVAYIERRDRDQYLDGVELEMPTGVLAKLRGIPLCPDALAAAGTCDVGSRVGSATVAAGAGSPFFLQSQPVYLSGSYKGAPYSLSVAARAKAGPFDLGMVVVRQALYVDPTDAHITVKSDPLPTIVKGVPLRLRSIDVKVDRPGFTLNPSSCAQKNIRALLHSQQGRVSVQNVRFQAGDCQALPLKPKLKLALTGRTQLTDGGHPGLKATLIQGAGQAGLKRVAVKLPLLLALDPNNAVSDGLCSFEESRKADPKCPASSIVGHAKAWTPLLNRPVEGPVFFSKNVRVDKNSGRQIRALPSLVIPLRGEVALNLVGDSATTKDGKLVNTFATVPDAPVSRFELTLKGGKKGILVVNGNACKRSRTAIVEIAGQNDKRADQSPKFAAPCAQAAKARKAKARQRAVKRRAARAHARR